MDRRILATQIRLARTLLNWTQEDLAEASGISARTIWQMENDPDGMRARAGTVERVRSALESAGVRLMPDGGVRPAAGRGRRKG